MPRGNLDAWRSVAVAGMAAMRCDLSYVPLHGVVGDEVWGWVLPEGGAGLVASAVAEEERRVSAAVDVMLDRAVALDGGGSRLTWEDVLLSLDWPDAVSVRLMPSASGSLDSERGARAERDAWWFYARRAWMTRRWGGESVDEVRNTVIAACEEGTTPMQWVRPGVARDWFLGWAGGFVLPSGDVL